MYVFVYLGLKNKEVKRNHVENEKEKNERQQDKLKFEGIFFCKTKIF